MERARSYLFLALLLAVTACSQKLAPQAEGGQHTGGGNYLESSAADVNSAIDTAIQLLNEPDRRENIFVQFWFEWGKQSKNPIIRRQERFFPELKIERSAADGEPAPAILERTQSPALSALKSNLVNRLQSGNCPNSVIKKHTDASVSSFDLGAEICFSIENLARISKASLLREVLSLAVHESAHMAGADEAEAVAWQQEFSAYFTARFGDVSLDSVTTPTLRLLSEAKSLTSRAKTLSPESKSARTLVARVTQKLLLLPDFSDELSLRLKTQPAHPELIANYYNAVLAAIRFILVNFDYQMMPPRPVSLPNSSLRLFVPDFKSSLEGPKALELLSQSLDLISENFLAFTGSDSDAQSVCTAADTHFDISYLSTKPLSATANRLFFPKRCTPPPAKPSSKTEPVDI